MDRKFDLMKHENIRFTPLAGGRPFSYGEDTDSFMSFSFDEKAFSYGDADSGILKSFLFFSDEEFEKLLEGRLDDITGRKRKTPYSGYSFTGNTGTEKEKPSDGASALESDAFFDKTNIKTEVRKNENS